MEAGLELTFHLSFGKGSSSAVWMVRLRVLVHTDTGMVAPSKVCTHSTPCINHCQKKDHMLSLTQQRHTYTITSTDVQKYNIPSERTIP